MLVECDPGASEFVEANRAALQPFFAEAAWQEFERLVQDYSFDEARVRLEQALAAP